MAKEPANGPPALPNDPLDQLGAIKNIIFGSEMQELNQRLKDLSEQHHQEKVELAKQLEALEARLDQNLTALQQSLLSEISTQVDSLRADLEQVQDQKADRKQIGEWLVKIGQDLLMD